MTAETTTPTPRTPRLTARGVVAWAVFLLAAGAFVASLVVVRAGHERAMETWRSEATLKARAGQPFRDKLRGMTLQSWEEVEGNLNMKLAEGKKVHPDNPNHRVGVVVDPVSGFTFDLAFYDNELRKAEPRPMDSPAMAGWRRGLDAVRMWLARVGWFGWLLLLARILMTGGRRRRALGQSLLGISILLFACVLLEGYPSSPWYAFLVRGWTAVAAVMPAVSVAALVAVYREPAWEGRFPVIAGPTPVAVAVAAGGFEVEDDEERPEEEEMGEEGGGEVGGEEGKDDGEGAGGPEDVPHVPPNRP